MTITYTVIPSTISLIGYRKRKLIFDISQSKYFMKYDDKNLTISDIHGTISVNNTRNNITLLKNIFVTTLGSTILLRYFG